MQQLHNLQAPPGARRPRKRIGRGESSGHGKTAGRGGKGQTARTGKGKPGAGFEGGQVPMYRRMPKRGFVNVFGLPTIAVNVDSLAAHFPAGAKVDLAALVARGLARRTDRVFRLLGRGEAGHALQVVADHATPQARQKIEAAGGSVALTGTSEAA